VRGAEGWVGAMSNELAGRAVACPGWRWPLGMRVQAVYVDGRQDVDLGVSMTAPVSNKPIPDRPCGDPETALQQSEQIEALDACKAGGVASRRGVGHQSVWGSRS